MTIGRTFLNGKLLIGYKRPKMEMWCYDGAPIISKVTTPDTPTEAFADFRKAVAMGIKEVNTNEAGRSVVDAFQKIGLVLEIVPATMGGFFIPNCSEAAAKGYEGIPEGVDGLIAWDPTAKFRDFPPWVILAHEMGNAIQLHTSKKSANSWLLEYIAKTQEVEMDNIGRHETPIVESLGLTPRTSYP